MQHISLPTEARVTQLKKQIVLIAIKYMTFSLCGCKCILIRQKQSATSSTFFKDCSYDGFSMIFKKTELVKKINLSKKVILGRKRQCP